MWARVRQSEAVKWESEEVKRPYFAAAKGNGAEQTVWRMMVRNGAALEKESGEGKKAVAQVV